jgi:hypothetical protein
MLHPPQAPVKRLKLTASWSPNPLPVPSAFNQNSV